MNPVSLIGIPSEIRGTESEASPPKPLSRSGAVLARPEPRHPTGELPTWGCPSVTGPRPSVAVEPHDFSRGRSQMLRSTTNVFPTRPVAKLWKACVDASSGDNPGSQERRESRRVGTRVLVKCLGVKWFEKLRLSSASETEGFADDEGTSIPRAAGAKRRLYRESKIRSVMEDCVFRTSPWHSPRLPVKSI